MIDTNTRIRRNPDVVFRPLEDEQGAVLLHMQSGEYHGLNELGSLIWGLMENETRFADLVDGVRAETEDAPTSVDEDVSRFVEDLNARDLVQLTP
ncbi:MAG TPA: PqqD family protein [Gaiellales bacterium]|nr:PqqD family protein [Gaiellales bacterium]